MNKNRIPKQVIEKDRKAILKIEFAIINLFWTEQRKPLRKLQTYKQEKYSEKWREA